MQQISQSVSDFFTPARAKALAALLRHKVSCGYRLCGSSAAMLLAALPRRKSPVVAIADDADSAGYLYNDLSHLLGPADVAFFPSGYKRDIRFGQADQPSRILRTEALSRWHSPEAPRIVVTYPEALAEMVAPPAVLSDSSLSFAVGVAADLSKAQQWLRDKGFTETDYVYEPGQFAVRGSILDIFGYSHELPLRIDFFGDEPDSIRTFSIETQLSVEKLDSVAVTSDISEQAGRGVSLLDFIPSDSLLAVASPDYLLGRIRGIASEKISDSALIAGEGDSDAMSNVVDPEAFASRFASFRRFVFTAAAGDDAGKPDIPSVDFDCSPQGIYHKNFDLIADSLSRFISEGYSIRILSDQPGQFDRLRAIFADRGDNIPFTAVAGTLHEGFVDHESRICFFTDHQIFDRFHKYTLRSDKARSGKIAMSLKELSAISVGDYIVHIDHGIGRFGGLLRTDIGGRTQEMVKLIYQDGDLVFVPIHALHKLSKYRGKDGVPPKISRLGGGQWQRIKDRTKQKLKDIARDLIRLYAARKDEPGYAFSPEGYLQQELEASFAYEDTPDQLSAWQAVRADMESARPMDRLVCGDVGFGKTEIAVRAAFKAAADGKQTAVLVPTTVLAYQHFRTFSERLRDFPVRVEYLSRARSPKQVKQILADLADGKIDIIIGTHKLIGKSVSFHDLGLLVIDEEQKFGVAVKERLKQLKTNVDTLTLSATPIPRTLQFSLMGARDLSSINTPPPNRRPIVTSVSTISDDIVAEAISFEMARGGQVFFINNHIDGLDKLYNMVHRLVPGARVALAHGQMPTERLEKTIVDFAAGEYDVLLSTTIVESGIDMPNVNTILINNAHRFGLSELHQLRGRVGRSQRKAFAYLFVPPDEVLPANARRRLQAIESFSDLGSGIHIAMQDLDIRGAGNLLGAEQSGFIADLGYEAYLRILREAVTELKNEEFAGSLTAEDSLSSAEKDQFVLECTIETDLELLFPFNYVPGESERINLYRELDNIERPADLDAFRSRLLDRFGPLPAQAEELLLVPRLRSLGRRLGIEKIVLKNGSMFTFFVGEENKAYYQSPMFGRLLQYLQMHPRAVAIRDKNGRRSFRFERVTSVRAAVAILDTILTLPPAN